MEVFDAWYTAYMCKINYLYTNAQFHRLRSITHPKKLCVSLQVAHAHAPRGKFKINIFAVVSNKLCSGVLVKDTD